MAGLFDGLLPGLGGGSNNDDAATTTTTRPAGGILGPLVPSTGDGNTASPSTTATVGASPALTLTGQQSTRTQVATSATANPTTAQTSAQTTQTTIRSAAPTTPTNQPTTMMTIPSPSPTTQDAPSAEPTTTPLDLPLSSNPPSQTTAAPQASGTLASATDNGSSQDTIAGLPKTTVIGIACGVGGLIFLLIVVFMVRRTLRNRREGNRQVLDRLDLTIGTSEAPVGSSGKPTMTRSMEDLNRSWNAGLEQYHQPPRAQVNAKGLGYSM